MSHVAHKLATRTNESRHTCACVMSRMRMSHVAHMDEACHTHE